MVRSPRQHSFTPPMHVEPVTTSRPDGASPDTTTAFTPIGSSLVIVMEADLTPKLVGAKRSGITNDVPGAISSGYAITFGVTNSPDDDAMLKTVSVHRPLFCSVSGR